MNLLLTYVQLPFFLTCLVLTKDPFGSDFHKSALCPFCLLVALQNTFMMMNQLVFEYELKEKKCVFDNKILQNKN